MLVISFAMLLVINLIQAWSRGDTVMAEKATRFVNPVDERFSTKLILTSIGGLYLAFFLFLPLVTVFIEAFRNGAASYWQALVEPDAAAAIG